MKCKNCNKEMELEEYYTDFLDNDEQICLREEFWCANCDIVTIKYSYYRKASEDIRDGK